MRSFVALSLCGVLAACGTVNGSSPGDDAPGGIDAAAGGGGALRFSDATYDFGDMTVGQTSFPFSAKITNSGSAPVGPLSVHLAGANADDFGVEAAACNAHTLGTGTDCALTITFAPKAAGARAASLVVDAGASSARLELTGNGLAPGALLIAPTPQQFDDTAIGAASSEVEFTITNAGDTALDAPALTTGDASFVVTPATCPDRLGPKSACKVRVSFKPLTGGVHATALTAKSGDQAGTSAIRGTGHGTLVVNRVGEAAASGTVTGGAVNCGTACTVVVAEAKISLTALASGAANHFDGWSPICGASATCEVPITAARTDVTATFGLVRHDLTVSTTGAPGTITADGLSCSGTSGTCKKAYVHGTSVALKATAGNDSAFDHWTGACQGVAGPSCTVVVDDARSATAVFKVQYTLTVTVGQGSDQNGVAMGTVTVVGKGGCGAGDTCTFAIDGPVDVTLSQVAEECSKFTSWGPPCNGTGRTCVVNVGRDLTVSAGFDHVATCIPR